MPQVAPPRTILAQPTAQQAQQAVQHAISVWQRTLPIWASDCLRLQARGLRDPRWTPFSSPELWDVDDAVVPTAA